MGITGASAAALAKLNTTASTLEKDTLLNIVCHLAPPLQLTVSLKKKGDTSLEILNGSTTLTQRNAMIRSLCGSALHSVLDRGPRFYIMGGHSSVAAACSPDSPAVASSAVALSAISSWMSVADDIRHHPEQLEERLVELDSYLAGKSFLVPAPGPTVADLDLCLAVCDTASKEYTLVGKVNVMRWFQQCIETIKIMIVVGEAAWENNTVTLPVVKLPDMANTLSPPSSPPVPLFFYGDASDGDVAAATAVAASASAPTAGPKGKPPAGEKPSPTAAAAGGDLSEQKKAAAEKRAKKNAEKAAKKKAGDGGKNDGKKDGAAASTDLNVTALDIRVGKILKAWNHEEAEKLYCEEVDVGEESGPRKIASGLRPFYSLDEMQGRSVLVLCNLKARNLVGFPSHGMVLCASNADHTSVEFVTAPEGAKIGERVMFEGLDGAPEAENKMAKKKLFEKLAPDLKTDGEGRVIWKEAVSVTSAGPCVASKGMKNGQVA